MKLLLIALLVPLAGCSYLKKNQPAKHFSIQKKWVRDTLRQENWGYRHNNRMRPIVTEEVVYQGNAIDGIAAYNRKSGHLIWRKDISGGVEAGAQLSDGILYFGASDGFFYAVDSSTGSTKWSTPIRAEGLGEPLVGNNKIFFIAGNNVVLSLEKSTGRQLWVYNRQDPSSISIRGGSRPSISGDTLYVGFSDGYVLALKKASGSVVWERPLNRNKRFRDVDSSPVVDGDRLYISSFDDGVYCLDRKNGQMIWRIDEGGFSSVTLTPRKVFFASSEGHVIAADKRSGKVLWKVPVKGGLATQPALFRGLLVYGESAGAFKVISAEDGKLVGRYDTGRGVSGEPYVDSETGDTFFITVNADLYSVRLDWVSQAEVWPWQTENVQ